MSSASSRYSNMPRPRISAFLYLQLFSYGTNESMAMRDCMIQKTATGLPIGTAMERSSHRRDLHMEFDSISSPNLRAMRNKSDL